MGIRHAIAFAVVAALAGCDGTRACRDGTALVSLQLDATSATADQIVLDVAFGGRTMSYTSSRTPGATSDSIEIDFASSYAAGGAISIDARALRQSAPVGTGHLEGTLAPGCSALTLAIAAGDAIDLGLPDAVHPGVDLATADAAKAAADLATVDLAPVADLGQPDLVTLPDLVALTDLVKLPPPSLGAVAPGKGPTTGGTQLTVGGANFVPGAKVFVAGIDAAAVYVSPTQLTATLPTKPGALGKVAVSVSNPDGQMVSRADLFAYYSGTVSFGNPVVSGNGAWGTPPQAGDWNGDGKLDLAVADGTNLLAGVFLGKGDGTFASPLNTVATGSGPYGTAAGDFNSDGKFDFVVVNAGSTNLGFYLGKGDGTLPAASTFATGSHPIWSASGDWNGDGKLDLVVTDDAGSSVSVLLGNGNGTFQPKVDYAAGVRPYFVIAGDFNGDSKPDFAMGTGGGPTVINVLVGKGDGTFTGPYTYPSGGTNPFSLAVGDFDGDGALDIACDNRDSNNIGILLNGKNGQNQPSFKAPVTYPLPASSFSLVSGDWNGDGVVDLAANDGGSITLLVGKGDGTFAVTPDIIKPAFGYILAGDWNGDGKTDIAGSAGPIVSMLNT